MQDVFAPSIEGWSTVRHFKDSNSSARESRRSSFSSSAASECSTFSKVSATSSATSASAGSIIFSSSQQSDLADEGYVSSNSQTSDGRLSEAFLESLDLGHPAGFCMRGSTVPGLPSATAPRYSLKESLPAVSLQKQNGPCQAQREPSQLHPRRTSASCGWSRPSLVRQKDRRLDFVEHLVDSATQLVAIIWPNSATSSSSQCRKGGNTVIPLRVFIRETLRRSRTSYSTLQVTLYYLVLIKKIKTGLPQCDSASEAPSGGSWSRALQCGRRMFLAGLILASKYLQDRNFSARAWSKISGLPVKEINMNEMAFLDAINWKLHIKVAEFNEWSNKVSQCTDAAQRGTACPWNEFINNVPLTSDQTSTTAPEVTSQLEAKPPTPIGFDAVDAWSEPKSLDSIMSAPVSRRPSWTSRQASSDNLPSLTRSSTPSILEPQCLVAPPAPPNLGRNLSTPQFTPTPLSASSNVSTPAVGSHPTSYIRWLSHCGSNTIDCTSWLARRCSGSSRSSQSSMSSGYPGAAHNRWVSPTGLATTQTSEVRGHCTMEKTPSLVASPNSLASSEDHTNPGSVDGSSDAMGEYPSPPMSDGGPISPQRSEVPRTILRSTEHVVAPTRPAFLPPRGPQFCRAYSKQPSLLSFLQSANCPSSESTTPTPDSYSTPRGLKRRVVDEDPFSPNNGAKYARTYLAQSPPSS